MRTLKTLTPRQAMLLLEGISLLLIKYNDKKSSLHSDQQNMEIEIEIEDLNYMGNQLQDIIDQFPE